MEIIPFSQRLRMVEYLQRLRFDKADWLVVDVKLVDPTRQLTSTEAVAEMLGRVFAHKEGRVMICGPEMVLMLIEWGRDNSSRDLTDKIESQLPPAACETHASRPTADGLQHLTLLIEPMVAGANAMYACRKYRADNIILVADDDIYTRGLIKAGLKDFPIVEVGDGSKVVEAYLEHNPDVVFLDIHLPGMTGKEILTKLKLMDAKAYVIMLSADSSEQNVRLTKQIGAKGFVTKPFTKAKLVDYVRSCPTLAGKSG